MKELVFDLVREAYSHPQLLALLSSLRTDEADEPRLLHALSSVSPPATASLPSFGACASTRFCTATTLRPQEECCTWQTAAPRCIQRPVLESNVCTYCVNRNDRVDQEFGTPPP